jgi:hypothetical protein
VLNVNTCEKSAFFDEYNNNLEREREREKIEFISRKIYE